MRNYNKFKAKIVKKLQKPLEKAMNDASRSYRDPLTPLVDIEYVFRNSKLINFDKIETIGHGAHSEVFKVKYSRNGGIYAMKVTDLTKFKPHTVKLLKQEGSLLQSLNHKNVL